MNCEICGIEIKGEPYKTKIDNSVMVTCKECSRYGKVQSKPQPTNKRAPKGKNNTNNYNNYNNKPKNKVYSRKNKEDPFPVFCQLHIPEESGAAPGDQEHRENGVHQLHCPGEMRLSG